MPRRKLSPLPNADELPKLHKTDVPDHAPPIGDRVCHWYTWILLGAYQETTDEPLAVFLGGLVVGIGGNRIFDGALGSQSRDGCAC